MVKQISDAVLASRGGTHGSWPWTRKLLAQADRQFNGAWRELTLRGGDAPDIRLPPHAGGPCKGDQLTPVGDAGGAVRDVAQKFLQLGDAYTRNNPSCAERIEASGGAPFSHLILCTAPLEWEEYAKVAPAPGAYYCIDGFHRLVAWAARGRLTPDSELRVWIAG